MLDEKLAANFLRLVEDSSANGVPELHFRFWRRADQSVKDQYVAGFRTNPVAVAWFEEGYLAPDPDFDSLLAMPEGSLGRRYATHVIDNGLSRTLASDYRAAHEAMEAAGHLDGMPPEARFSTLRGFQVHDVLHPLTGYLTDGPGEMALQAFTLAQARMPYSAMWMATLTTQMTFLHPKMTGAVMDAISDGWQLGRQASNLMYVRWEDHFERQVEDLRADFGLARERTSAAV
jgi:ubiquinone biosynthesis protein COQ4